MNPLDDLLDSCHAPADDGIALMTELVAAVNWLRRGAMPGLTIWEAFERALRRSEGGERKWSDPDPFRTALRGLVETPSIAPSQVVMAARLRSWLDSTSVTFNSASPWGF
jgi:hypothetical protein